MLPSLNCCVRARVHRDHSIMSAAALAFRQSAGQQPSARESSLTAANHQHPLLVPLYSITEHARCASELFVHPQRSDRPGAGVTMVHLRPPKILRRPSLRGPTADIKPHRQIHRLWPMLCFNPAHADDTRSPTAALPGSTERHPSPALVVCSTGLLFVATHP